MSKILQEAEQKKQEHLRRAQATVNTGQGDTHARIALIYQLEQLTYILSELERDLHGGS